MASDTMASDTMASDTMASDTSKTPITILTGFTGSGKTTLLLNTLPQLRAINPSYTLCLIKNEIGDVAVDTALASSAALSGSKELLGDCICCTNVGQVEDALAELRQKWAPDRVVIETSGSAEPVKLMLEVNRIAKATGLWELDGVVSVVDAENWGGYANTSYTAKLQAKQTDLIVINKWESLDERAYDTFLDRLGDLDVDTPQVKSDKGVIGVDVIFGFDRGMARAWLTDGAHSHDHDHKHEHKDEVECIYVTLTPPAAHKNDPVDLTALEKLLKSAPKDEVFRIKAILYATSIPEASDGTAVSNGDSSSAGEQLRRRWILNWSFGRWTWSLASEDGAGEGKSGPVLRMSIFTAPYESTKWMKRIREGGFVRVEGEGDGGGGEGLEVKKVQ